MLLQDFFTIIDTDIAQNEALIELELNPRHSIFQGHFPGYPITPGVCVTQMAVDLFSLIQQQEYIMAQAKSIKFLQIIRPEENPRVHYRMNWEPIAEQQYRMKVVVYHEDTTFAKIDITVNS
jgi:3-hydroxyacyl-[acyl-carrier-protein] dehydratase